MRYASLVIGLSLLLATPARAEEELLAPYADFRAVAVMVRTGQALFWDPGQKTYLLGRVGETMQGWKILSVQTDQVIVAREDGTRDNLPLTGMPTEMRTGKGLGPTRPVRTPPVVHPPTAPFVVPTPAKKATPPAVIASPEPKVKLSKLIEKNFTIRRKDLNREISDFDRLLKVVSVSPVPGDGFLLTRVGKPSWWHKIGLRQGDLVTSIAGERITSVDDAARVYARLQSLKKFTIELQRGPQRVALHYRVRS